MKLTGRLQFLDALRGLAALAVMCFHFFATGVSPLHSPLAGPLPAWLSQVIGHLYCGVDVFFVLSGFVIAFSMAGHAAHLRYAGNFILRRCLRLDPPYWVAAALMVGYYLVMWPGKWHDFYSQYGGLPGVLANLFYVQNLPYFYPAHSILDVSWTLCLEVQFYLVYLLILVGAYYGRRRWLLGLGVATLGLWSLAHWLLQTTPDFTGRVWTFLLGVSLYHALHRRLRARWVLLPLAGLGALFLWRGQAHGVTTVATAVAIYSAGLTGRLGSLLAYRPLLYLGRISYSLYLLHMVLGLNLLTHLAPWIGTNSVLAWLAVALAIALSLTGAELLHRWVEAPAHRLSQRLKPKPSPTKTSAAVPSALPRPALET